jgi:hypothetical protein
MDYDLTDIPANYDCGRDHGPEALELWMRALLFPSSRAMIEELLPDRAELRESFEREGFRMTAWEVITQVIAPSWKAYADKLSAGGDSILARLSREELESGLAAIRHHDAEGVAGAIVEPIDLFVFR